MRRALIIVVLLALLVVMALAGCSYGEASTQNFTILFSDGNVFAFDANFSIKRGDLILYINDRIYTNLQGPVALAEDEETFALHGGLHGYGRWEITSDDVDTIYALVKNDRFTCTRYGRYGQKCIKVK